MVIEYDGEMLGSRFTWLVMVVIAVCSTLISTSGAENFLVDRAGLLSGSILSSILVFQSAVKHNPDMSMNPLMQYIIIGLFFILLSFLQYWFLSVTWFSVRRQRQIDIGYLVITFLAYLVFVYYLFWDWKLKEAEAEACHNLS